MRSISVYYICAVTITKAVSPFFQIQLLNVSAEPSVLHSGTQIRMRRKVFLNN
jgi:hypothetical protein